MNVIEINKEMTMKEVFEHFPSAQRAIFQGFHIGGCQSCGYSLDESIQQVCDKHMKSTDDVIAHIYKSDEIDKAMRMNAEEAKDWISKEKVEIIDVREPYEAEEGSINDAKLLDRPLMGEIMNTWEKDTNILAYCASGQRSADFASYLIGHDFTNVKSLDQGIASW